MSTNDRIQVALFIDWDNLAISTAADLGGATPDLKSIVQRAQQYGTVVVAKAYAEWQVTSDRLAIYRNGVEPVYAPTFRFEPDAAGQPSKGKSLADPCMVADCVDALHLLPDVSVYVLVTGDKDMIPVVRLAQLRGRRVVVIGPDFVAGVLREMADEFVPYRSLIETPPPRPAPEPTRRYAGTHPEEPSRRRGVERHQPAPSYGRPERPIEKLVEKIVEKAPPAVPAPTPAPVQPAARPKVEALEPVVEVAAEERPQRDDLRSVFSAIVDILRQRREEGRERVRATNLKDALMQRMPGFSERRYGFGKFKDLLGAAEKSGLVEVTMAGPVHWISLPGTAEAAKVAAERAGPSAPAVPATPETAGALEQPAAAELSPVEFEERRNEMIRFIHDLRDRSRWLTYTYVLTNLISHFGKSLPQQAADAQARGTLNYLVQQGVLHVDKEPQEVEVGGARHRVRMCHLNLTHPLVIELLAATPGDEQQPELPAAAEAGTASIEEGPEGVAEPPIPGWIEASPLTTGADVGPADMGPSGNGSPRLGDGAGVGADSTIVEATAAPVASPEPAELDVAPAIPESATPLEAPPAEAPSPVEQHEEQPVTEPATTQESQMPTELPSEPPAAAAGEGAGDLGRVFATLEGLIYEVTSQEKPMISASSLRSRLIAALGAFNERQLGFSRFKDFLLAAQNAGIVKIITKGYVTWVTPPNGSGQQAG